MSLIGNTPLIKLTRLAEPGSAEIFVKYEGANPTGSMKDHPQKKIFAQIRRQMPTYSYICSQMTTKWKNEEMSFRR